MTELATYQAPTAPAVAAPMTLRTWADEARAASALATSLCQTSFVPDAFRGKPAEATAAILAGSEMGLSPLAALNAYDVIQGRPAPKAITLRAVAMSHGRLIWPVKMTPTECVMRCKHPDWPEPIDVTWDMKRARDLKLANKPNWQMQPQAMLVARATSEAARLVAPDVLLGIPYSAEELADQEPTATVAVKREPAPTTKVQRAKPPLAAVPEPDLEPSGLDEFHEATTQNPTGPAPSITRQQQAALMASFNEAGITDRTDRLLFCTDATGRTIDSTNALSRDEAKVCLNLVKNPGYVEKWRDGGHGDGTLPVGAE